MTSVDSLTSTIEHLDFDIEAPCETIIHQVFDTPVMPAKWILIPVQCCEAATGPVLACDPCWQFIVGETTLTLVCNACRRTFYPLRTCIARVEPLKP